jgi:hypothetical protein
VFGKDDCDAGTPASSTIVHSLGLTATSFSSTTVALEPMFSHTPGYLHDPSA